MADPTHYELLGVAPAATLDEIKKRYRQLARQYHPDVASAPDSEIRFRLINEAYRILSDSERRNVYDAELKLASLKRSRPAASPSPSSSPPPPPEAGRRGAAPRPSGRQTTGPRPRQDAARPAAELLDKAKTAFRHLRYREAESLCRQALRYGRRNVEVYELLGDIQHARGQQDEAIAMYSYALQLDRTNRSVQEKFDRLVGRKSGPTMAGHAAHATRRTIFTAPPAQKPAPLRLLATGIGILAGALLLAVILINGNPAATSVIPLDWDPQLLFSLAGTGAMCGFLFAVNGLVRPCRAELSAPPRSGRPRSRFPLASILVAFSLLFFYAAFLVYMLVAFLQDSISPSVLRAFAASFAIVAIFSMVSHASALYVLLAGGNVVFLSFVAGWILGDLFRSAP